MAPAGASATPSADSLRPSPKLGGNRAGRAALCRKQHNAGPFDNPVFSLRRSDHGFKGRTLLLRQRNRRRFLYIHLTLETRRHFQQ
jgi:hypothetical protein